LHGFSNLLDFSIILSAESFFCSARPLFSTIEVLTGLDPRTVPNSQALVGASGLTRGFLRLGIRVLIMVSFVVIAIFFPYFDRLMAFLGSALCFTLCIILPLAFHLKIFGRQIPLKERVLNYCLIAISAVLAVTGTVWAFLPRDILPYR
jgi:vesicular inhibitory amino acid transporter